MLSSRLAWTFAATFLTGLSPLMAAAAVAEPTSATSASPTVPGSRVLKVPEGFTIERIAGPPLVNRPITAAFDERGRLYLADSSGSNENVQKQVVERPHRIVRLVDRDSDGHFDEQTVFADKMMFPEGTMWHDGSLYVAAPPSIWKLTDTDGDGVADRRVEWFQGKTLTGCANDLHGPYNGPDGWIYWCKGAFAQQTYERPGQPPFVSRAAHIFRSRPDGSGIEPVMTGGMDNPVDVTFTPGGERIFTTTFFQNPGGGRRDGLVHAIYGGVYGKVQGAIFEPVHKWTGPEVMPVLLHMGPAAPCGLTRLESSSLGDELRDNLFACYFNLHKVSRHVLAPSGATFTTKDEDFVTSPDLDFHPTDLIEDADGSLVVVDTGGWYKLCCPSSQLAKPDVMGGVYRVRRKGSAPVADPRGLGLPWKTMAPEALTALLDDPRPAVQRRAIETLGRGVSAEAAVKSLWRISQLGRSPESRRNAHWALARIDHPRAREAARATIDDEADESVRQVASHVIALWRDGEAVQQLAELLVRGTPANRRVAAEGLARIGHGAKSAVPSLLQAAGANPTPDRQLEHSITYALIEIGDRVGIEAGLGDARVAVRRAALVALDQMDGGTLDPRRVAELLASRDASLKETASWIIGRHPEWADALAGSFRDRLLKADLAPAERTELERQLARFAAAGAIQSLLTDVVADDAGARASRLSGLRAMAQAGLKAIPARWHKAVDRALDRTDAELTREAVLTARSFAAATAEKAGGAAQPLTPRLLAIAGRPQAPAEVRLNALAAVPRGLARVEPAAFTFLVGQLDRELPVATRGIAADVLARARLSSAQLQELADAIKTAGPLEVNRLLDAFEQATDEATGLALVKAILESSALSSLRIDALRLHLAKYPPAVQSAAETIYTRLNADLAKQKARIDELMTKLASGDVRRGQAVFHSEKATCFTCHAIGYRGGNVGPDLTKVGAIRSERELLEAIVYPSASFIRSYEPVVIAISDGKVVNGLIRNETSDELVLATGANQEARVARAEIEEIRPGTISVMPAGLDQQLTTQEIADLVAFLRAAR